MSTLQIQLKIVPVVIAACFLLGCDKPSAPVVAKNDPAPAVPPAVNAKPAVGSKPICENLPKNVECGGGPTTPETPDKPDKPDKPGPPDKPDKTPPPDVIERHRQLSAERERQFREASAAMNKAPDQAAIDGIWKHHEACMHDIAKCN